MNVLGIAIKITNNGAGEPVVINEGGWTRHVADVRSVLSKVDGADSQNRHVVRFISFTDEGCLLTVARYIGGRQGDNIAVWIFIPSKIDISAKDIIDTMEVAEHAIMASKIDKSDLERICRQQYPVLERGYSKSPQGDTLAYRYYDNAKLEVLLGPYRYQSYYDDFSHIILLDQKEELRIANPDEAVDLSRRQNNPPLLLLPLSSEQLKQYFFYDIKMQLEDGTPFDKPVSMKKNEKIKLKLVREGFDPIIVPFTMPYNEGLMSLPIDKMKPCLQNWQMTFTMNDIVIVDEKDSPIPDDEKCNLVIEVNGNIVKYDETYKLFENKAKNAILVVTDHSFRYKQVKKEVNLLKKPVKVTLCHTFNKQETTIVTRNGEEASLNYKVMGLETKEESPIEGYHFNTDNQLVYDTRHPWILRLQGFLAATVIALVCLLVACLLPVKKTVSEKSSFVADINHVQQVPLDNHDSESVSENQVNLDDHNDEQGLQMQRAAETNEGAAYSEDNIYSYSQAIDYLDKNKIWKREEMELFEDLRGLFDDMNKFQLKQITGKWKSALEGSEKFQKIVEVAEKNIKQRWNPAVGIHCPYYNKLDDSAIVVLNYIYWLDRDQTKPVNQENGNQTGKVGQANKARKTGQVRKTGQTNNTVAGRGNNSIDG